MTGPMFCMDGETRTPAKNLHLVLEPVFKPSPNLNLRLGLRCPPAGHEWVRRRRSGRRAHRRLAQDSSLRKKARWALAGKEKGGVYFSGKGGGRSGQGNVLQLLVQRLEVIQEAGWGEDVRGTWAAGEGQGDGAAALGPPAEVPGKAGPDSEDSRV